MSKFKKLAAAIAASVLIFAIFAPSGASAATSNSFAAIDDARCSDIALPVTASGEAAVSGQYSLQVFAEDGKFYPVASGFFLAGDNVSLQSVDTLSEGESVSVILVRADPAAADDSVAPVVSDRKVVTRPSTAFCAANPAA